MSDNRNDTGHEAGAWLAWALLGVIAGSAWQLQQPRLWNVAAYALLAGSAIAVLALGALLRRGRYRALPVLLAAGAMAFSAVGLRAVQFAGQALQPALEGKEIVLTGIVAAMPQRNDDGLRFRLELESARIGRDPVPLPPQLYLGWYGAFGADDVQRQPQDVRAGERWQLTARLKAPHGTLNPHGFDYELWLWEQGLQATGYVRAGPKDAPPRRLATGWSHPVERARQSVRDAIYARVQDHKAAGLLAALVVGDQNAIDRADWDIFRATGVAHLMSIPDCTSRCSPGPPVSR